MTIVCSYHWLTLYSPGFHFFILSFSLISSGVVQPGDMKTHDELALALSRGLELDTQRSSRDSIQCSSGYSTQTNTPCCSEDTIPSQGLYFPASPLLSSAQHHSSSSITLLCVSLQCRTVITSPWQETKSPSSSSSSQTLTSPPPFPETVTSVSPTGACSRPNGPPPQPACPSHQQLIPDRWPPLWGLIRPHPSMQEPTHLPPQGLIPRLQVQTPSIMFFTWRLM